ncbi:hypothetical protein NC653_038962 [Populus alba x Populus x berolinensis]|uniref:Uncharacterized protein n=1 Tax=Populus alba x Populus x berolinensis TaxID=444605 RepID=A0AAD6LCN8_9ROSI|nr:hypothetical protein NC653_038962 [Populus alba x Populus x berolinensis]
MSNGEVAPEDIMVPATDNSSSHTRTVRLQHGSHGLSQPPSKQRLETLFHSSSRERAQASVHQLLSHKKFLLHHETVSTCLPSSASPWPALDRGGNKEDLSSTSAYVIYLGQNPISWSSKKQHTTTRSSTEAEYRAVADTTAEISWISSLLSELHFPVSHTPVIYYDNIGATQLSSNPVFHSIIKHIAIDFHFIRQKVQSGTLRVSHVSSNDQLADALMKSLPRSQFWILKDKIGLIDPVHLEGAWRKLFFGTGAHRDLSIDFSKVPPRYIFLSDGMMREMPWKGASIALPMFYVRSEVDLGVGEFLDLKLFVDWEQWRYKEKGRRKIRKGRSRPAVTHGATGGKEEGEWQWFAGQGEWELPYPYPVMAQGESELPYPYPVIRIGKGGWGDLYATARKAWLSFFFLFFIMVVGHERVWVK